MVYRITVDGKRKYSEASITQYSVEADNLAREQIINHYLEDEGAVNVEINTEVSESREIYAFAAEFATHANRMLKIWESLPDDSPWNIREIEILIPLLMESYMLAMKLPDQEYMEDAEYETEIVLRKGAFQDADELNEDLIAVIMCLSEGIQAYNAGLVCEAIFVWKFDLVDYYGRHLIHALSVMSDMWERDKRIHRKSKKTYWC